ncbi:hypothetical protein KCP73_23940 [Salmonella enterica subsp. enterica]|nr:hypothetical protein KCP73_23940 [Salmonella enterica subsp. enterica]
MVVAVITPFSDIKPAPPSGGPKEEIWSPKIKFTVVVFVRSLQQLHHRCLFQQLAVATEEQKYVSVTAETKTGLFILAGFRGPLQHAVVTVHVVAKILMEMTCHLQFAPGYSGHMHLNA